MTMNTSRSLLRMARTVSCRASVRSSRPVVSLLSSFPGTNYGLITPRTFSDDSHSDFAPKRSKVDGDDEALKLIEEHVKSNPIMVYMKGNPQTPMCGFSAQVVQVLREEGVDFASVNVLDYPAIREGVKKYADWPTIPQLYVNGEFVGGCDIVLSMHESGELAELLQEYKKEQE